MPIASPPTNFDEWAPTTSGKPCGPEVRIVTNEGATVTTGQEGETLSSPNWTCFRGLSPRPSRKGGATAAALRDLLPVPLGVLSEVTPKRVSCVTSF